MCRKEYPECFELVERLVKQDRMDSSRDVASASWWQFWRPRGELYRAISGAEQVLVITRVSKYVVLVFVSTNQIFMDKVIVLPFNDNSKFALFQSSFYDHWAWHYSSTLGAGTVNISPSDCFATFAYPQDNDLILTNASSIGSSYHSLRQSLMHSLSLGLTKIYNLFHTRELTIAEIGKVSKQPAAECEKALIDILHLRTLHSDMDKAVLAAYGWDKESLYGPPIDLRHDFYEVEYLPEDDRVRYTIHPDARREVLKRLLKLNHERHDEEVKAGLWEKKKSSVKKNNETKKAESAPTTSFSGVQEELPVYAPGEAKQQRLEL